jgi:hypothetical protein
MSETSYVLYDFVFPLAYETTFKSEICDLLGYYAASCG